MTPSQELSSSQWLWGLMTVGVKGQGPHWSLRESWQGSLSVHLTGKFQSELRDEGKHTSQPTAEIASLSECILLSAGKALVRQKLLQFSYRCPCTST